MAIHAGSNQDCGCDDHNAPNPEIVRNNIDIKKTFFANDGSPRAVLAAVNNLAQYQVFYFQSIWFIVFVMGANGAGTSVYKYKMFNRGEGLYGAGATQLVATDIELVYVTQPTVEDIDEEDPATQIIDFVLFLDWNVWDWLNEQAEPVVIQPQNAGYTLFQGLVNGKEESYLFIGAAGTYGIGGMLATQADFQLLNKETTPALQTLRGYGVDNADPVNPIIKEIKDLPVDFEFYLSTDPAPTSNGAMKATYITDTRRLLDLSAFIPPTVTKIYTYELHQVDENTLFIIGQEIISNLNDDPGNYFAMSLKGCKIIDNILNVGSYEYRNIIEIFRNPNTNVPNNIHGINFNRGYIFANTRTDYVGSPVQVFKINPFNLQDYKFVNFPLTTGFVSNLSGGTTDILCYENYLYLLNAQNPSASTPAYLIRIDENLNNPEVVMQLNNPDINRRVPRTSPFLIYNDKVYVPLVQNGNGGAGKLGLSVYDLFKKTLIAELPPVAINANILVGSTSTVPHWMAEHNGKIIIHTAAGGSNQSRSLVRFDSSTLALEASTPLPSPLTDDNLITRDGYVILNPENSTTAYQLKIRYDFVNNQVPENYSPGYFWALGNSRNKSFVSSLKTKLSEFENDLPFKTINGETIQGPGNIVVSANADSKLDLAGGTLTGTLNTANVYPVGTANIGTATLKYNSIFSTFGYFNGIYANVNTFLPFRGNAGANAMYLWLSSAKLNIGTSGTEPTDKLNVEGSIRAVGVIKPGQFTTGTEPAYEQGATYYNTTLKKLRIGGATAWETVQSS